MRVVCFNSDLGRFLCIVIWLHNLNRAGWLRSLQPVLDGWTVGVEIVVGTVIRVQVWNHHREWHSHDTTANLVALEQKALKLRRLCSPRSGVCLQIEALGGQCDAQSGDLGHHDTGSKFIFEY